jgi:LmbE family N-acetylglucosaminyl deacetylase
MVSLWGRICVALLIIGCGGSALLAQNAEGPRPMDAGEIRLALEKLNVLGRVLYVAAHPDDENTGLIAYWANGALYDAGYLSLTRGDGGQNLIGPELREQLGVIRTQELLAARRIDHGQQFFSRANDFGFSKSKEETLRIWDRDKILADVVWTIRKFRPDVVVTRFTADDNATHGHHSASAQLAQEAFRAAADPKRFPEQLQFVSVWQPTRLLWNTSSFFFRARNQPFDKTGLVEIDAGGYQPLLGKSYAEIAAASRTMHKSQGFGVNIERGEQKEYFKFTDGKPVEGTNLFSGIDTTWARVPKAANLTEKIRAVIDRYDMKQPSASVPALLEVRKSLGTMHDDFWAKTKLAEVDGIIAACLGLHLEAVTEKPNAQPGEPVALQVEAINRSPVAVQLKSMRLGNDAATAVDTPLPPNELVTKKATATLAPTAPSSQPYWLRDNGTVGTFAVADQTLIGQPENPPPLPVELTIAVGDQEIAYKLEARSRKVDRVQGEISQPLVVGPPVVVDLPRPVFVFGNTQPKPVSVRVIAAADKFTGQVALEAPAGWKIEPASAAVDLQGAESETSCTFQITPPSQASEGMLRAVTVSASGERREAFGRIRIDYSHIEPQTLIPRAEAKLVRAEIQNTGRHVGYLPGAGDAIPESLREIGSDVEVLNDQQVKADNLARFDAVVLGVRAYNVNTVRMTAWFPELLAYAKKGGVVIVQYNTTPGPKPELLPKPLRISHDRVTDETAEMRILAPDSPLLNAPNKITADDFKGWVQERGLYFADQWDPAWKPIFSSNDPGEKPLDGGELVLRCDQGWFIYTGYSWFRQLPAGVPGAYRLFANMVSLRGAK